MSTPYERLTVARVRVLRGLADGYTQPQLAERLGTTAAGIRSQVDDLKEVTGCCDVHELGRWWREHRRLWLAFMSEAGGCG